LSFDCESIPFVIFDDLIQADDRIIEGDDCRAGNEAGLHFLDARDEFAGNPYLLLGLRSAASGNLQLHDPLRRERRLDCRENENHKGRKSQH
jgi:hypothetical protein